MHENAEEKLSVINSSSTRPRVKTLKHIYVGGVFKPFTQSPSFSSCEWGKKLETSLNKGDFERR